MKKSSLKIGICLMVIFSCLGISYTYAQVASTSTANTTSAATATTTLATTTAPSTTPPISVKTQVQNYFADIPVMINIARCESTFRQFADSGNIFRGGTNGKMIGIYQISEDVHRAYALSRGMNIDTVEGNMQYARLLYQQSGTNPWIASMPCWNTNPVPEGGIATSTSAVMTAATSVPTPATPVSTHQTMSGNLSVNLIFGMEHPEVKTLQQLLNRAGFQVAATDAGSPGNETTKFGSLTRIAVKKFQCAQNIVCTGDEYTTAYGMVGPKTRQVLMSVASGAPVPAIVPITTIPPTTSSTNTQSAAEQNRVANIKTQIEQLKQQIKNLEAQLPQ